MCACVCPFTPAMLPARHGTRVCACAHPCALSRSAGRSAWRVCGTPPPQAVSLSLSWLWVALPAAMSACPWGSTVCPGGDPLPTPAACPPLPATGAPQFPRIPPSLGAPRPLSPHSWWHGAGGYSPPASSQPLVPPHAQGGGCPGGEGARVGLGAVGLLPTHPLACRFLVACAVFVPSSHSRAPHVPDLPFHTALHVAFCGRCPPPAPSPINRTDTAALCAPALWDGATAELCHGGGSQDGAVGKGDETPREGRDGGTLPWGVGGRRQQPSHVGCGPGGCKGQGKGAEWGGSNLERWHN